MGPDFHHPFLYDVIFNEGSGETGTGRMREREDLRADKGVSYSVCMASVVVDPVMNGVQGILAFSSNEKHNRMTNLIGSILSAVPNKLGSSPTDNGISRSRTQNEVRERSAM